MMEQKKLFRKTGTVAAIIMVVGFVGVLHLAESKAAKPKETAKAKKNKVYDGYAKLENPMSDSLLWKEQVEADWLRQVGQFYRNDLRQAITGMLELTEKTINWIDPGKKKTQWRRALSNFNAQKEKVFASDRANQYNRFYLAIRWFRRKILLSHPKLNFESLLINKRAPSGYSHQCDQYLGRHSTATPGLCRLDSWKSHPKCVEFLKGKLPVGASHHPELSWDGKRVAFGFCDHREKQRERRRFFLWEATLDGKTVRPLTGTARDPLKGRNGRHTVLIEDFDPCYLPDGSIVFVSTRSQNFGRCHGRRYTPSYLLYKCDADGNNIRQLSFGEANEWDPSVLPDGRIVYTRWDYINRHDTYLQGLWVTRQDGTGTAHYFGSYTRNPAMSAEARPIPGTRKVISTSMAHHSYTAGSMTKIDPQKGEDGKAPVTKITPEIPFPESEARHIPGAFATPWPITEKLYLAAFTPEPLAWQGRTQSLNAYGIYLVDDMGGRELVYRDPKVSSFCPIPIQPRPKPRLQVSSLPEKPAENAGVFYIQNVYQARQPLPKDSVKAIRINRIFNQPTAAHAERGAVQQEVPKKILGTVPVGKDGSVAFKAPSGVPLQLQCLDKDGMAIMTMRSFIYLMPGEVSSCVGCHEPRGSTPDYSIRRAKFKVKPITPPAGPQYKGGLRFAATVQPVLDRYCIRCHGLDGKTAGGMDLTGTFANQNSDTYIDKAGKQKKLFAPSTRDRIGFQMRIPGPRSYWCLTGRKGLVALAHRNRQTDESRLKDYFAHAGRLAHMLKKGHKGVKLDNNSFARIVGWLDLNAQCYGDYSFHRPEFQKIDKKAEKILRKEIESLFGKKIAAQPIATLINVTIPSESRVLKAPLAISAGGWGQLKPQWASTNDAGYQKMKKLVKAAIVPMKYTDTPWGTSSAGKCECGWVIEAENDYKKRRNPPKK